VLHELQQLTYAPYYTPYLERIKHADLQQELQDSAEAFSTFIRELPAGKWQYRYAPGKWTVAQVVHHVIECEIIFSYRALTIAREPAEVTLPGFDENEYAAVADLREADGTFLHRYFLAVRNSTLGIMKTLHDPHLNKIGTANGYKVGVKSLFFISSGHCRHHMQVIRDRYLS